MEALCEGLSPLFVAKYHCPTEVPQARRGASVSGSLFLWEGTSCSARVKLFCAAEEQGVVWGTGFARGTVSSAAPRCSGIYIL